jgi:AcrR family transcriptional regulator
MPSTRPYDNRLRQEQAQGTADRIVAALCDLLIEERPANVSIPEVAKRAGVSVRTVYSHFPTKDDLFEALSPYVARTYFDAYQGPGWDPDGSMRDLAQRAGPSFVPVIPLFVALTRAGIDDDQHAKARSEQRLDHMAQVLRNDVPELDGAPLQRLAAIFGAVVSWHVVQRLLRAGEDAESTGELLAWVSDALIAHARAEGLPGGAHPAADAGKPTRSAAAKPAPQTGRNP